MRSRRDPNKARLTLVLAMLVIVLGEILAGLLIDRAPLEIRFPDAPRIIRAARKHGSLPGIIFFGGSRFQSQLNAETVKQELGNATGNEPPPIFNAAISYGEPVVFDFLITKLLETGIRPSMAVIEVSPETVSRRNIALEVHLTRQFNWADVLTSLPDVFYSHRVPRLLSTRVIPAYQFRSEFRQRAFEALRLQFLFCCPVGSTHRPQTQGSNLTVAERLMRGASVTRKRLRNFQVGGISARALERLIERYKALGVTMILLGVPISSPSRREYVSEIDAAFLAYMQRLSETYGVRFVDYRARVPDNFFRSAYYTTDEGTLYISRLLTREVLIPLWRERSLQKPAASARS